MFQVKEHVGVRQVRFRELGGIFGQLEGLYRELYQGELDISLEQVASSLGQPGSYLFGSFDDKRLVGVASLHIFSVLIGRYATIHDVVVTESYRRQGIARNLVNLAIGVARDEEKVMYCEIMARPQDSVPNALYGKLLTPIDRNIYRVYFD